MYIQTKIGSEFNFELDVVKFYQCTMYTDPFRGHIAFYGWPRLCLQLTFYDHKQSTETKI